MDIQIISKSIKDKQLSKRKRFSLSSKRASSARNTFSDPIYMREDVTNLKGVIKNQVKL